MINKELYEECHRNITHTPDRLLKEYVQFLSDVGFNYDFGNLFSLDVGRYDITAFIQPYSITFLVYNNVLRKEFTTLHISDVNDRGHIIRRLIINLKMGVYDAK